MNELSDILWNEFLFLTLSAFFGLILSIFFNPDKMIWCMLGSAMVFHFVLILYYAAQELWKRHKKHQRKKKYYSRYIH